MAQGKMGRMYKRKNTKHTFGEATDHIWIRIEGEDGGNERWARFSSNDILVAVASAARNIEDAPPVGAFRDLLD